jgi:hypothetical protein
MQNVDVTIGSQYSNSPTLDAVITAINSWLDPAATLANFYSYVKNINTAQGYGLDIIGRIVDVSRVFVLTGGSYFGWEGPSTASGSMWGPGGTKPWFTVPGTTNNYALADSAYRQVLLAKMALNITNGSIPATNAILQDLFVTNSFVPGRTGQAFCVDGCNMTMAYDMDVTPPLTAIENAIIGTLGIFPKPTGVSVTVLT